MKKIHKPIEIAPGSTYHVWAEPLPNRPAYVQLTQDEQISVVHLDDAPALIAALNKLSSPVEETIEPYFPNPLETVRVCATCNEEVTGTQCGEDDYLDYCKLCERVVEGKDQSTLVQRLPWENDGTIVRCTNSGKAIV